MLKGISTPPQLCAGRMSTPLPSTQKRTTKEETCMNGFHKVALVLFHVQHNNVHTATRQNNSHHRGRGTTMEGGGGGGGGVGDQQAGLFAQSWILQSGSLSKCGGPQTALTTDVGQVQLQAWGHKKGSTTGLWPQEGQYYRPGATRRAVLQAWGHKKGSTTGLWPQEGQYYRPGATRRAVLQAWGHKKGSTTGLGPQEGQLNDRRHTAYCGHNTTQQAVFTHLPVRAGKVLFLSSSNYKINKGG